MMSEEDQGGDGVVMPLAADVNLLEIITKRKAERKLKAEQKRQEDLQRIRDMRSTTGIDPLQRFPKEIWMEIFNDLDPKDLGNVWQVHPLFRDLFKKNRVRDILFPKILTLDLTEFWGALELEDEDDDRHYPFQQQLRRVSKHSRKSFDLLMENRLKERMKCLLADEDDDEDADIVKLCTSDEEGISLLNRLYRTFVTENSESKFRFFPRALSVTFKKDEGQDYVVDVEVIHQFKEKITKLLERIGDQIWHFRFFFKSLSPVVFHDVFRTSIEVYTMFHGWISLMPNLKWLEVEISPIYQTVDEDEDDEEGMPPGLAKLIPPNPPFPHLPHLERLSFHRCYRFGLDKMDSYYNIFDGILGANQHVKMLDLDDRGNAPPPLEMQPHRLIQSLQLNWLHDVDPNCYDQEDDDDPNPLTSLERLHSLLNSNWPLREISLSLSGERKGDSIVPVFQFLEQFPTLETVRLTPMRRFQVANTDKLGYLKLPNLVTLQLVLLDPEINYGTNIHFFYSLQFLLHCAKLKKILWTISGLDVNKLREHLRKEERKHLGTMLDFRAGIRYLYDSNFWDVFRSLDTLHVVIGKEEAAGRDKCCRHDYHRQEMEGMSPMRFLEEQECESDGNDCVVRCEIENVR